MKLYSSVHTKIVFAVITALLFAEPCLAWSEGGHRIIASMAYDQLKPATQKRLLEILKSHPRIKEDFKLPTSLPTELEAAHWVVGTAGYWPDIARNQPLFHRSTWHYQLGSSLTLGTKVNVPNTPGPLPANASLATEELNIAQAIELCTRILSSKEASDADKALAICWLAHLVADSHQPCHAGSLYAEAVFPEGDRGANSIPTKQGRNLHALWDGLLGSNDNRSDLNRRRAEILQKAEKNGWFKKAKSSADPQA